MFTCIRVYIHVFTCVCLSKCPYFQYVDCLKLKIPWKNLYSAPIIAEIDGLYVIAGPASGNTQPQHCVSFVLWCLL